MGLPVLGSKHLTTKMIDSHGVSVPFKSAKHTGLFVFIFLVSKAGLKSARSFRGQSADGRRSELEAGDKDTAEANFFPQTLTHPFPWKGLAFSHPPLSWHYAFRFPGAVNTRWGRAAASSRGSN